MDDTRLSKAMSYYLRHRPDRAGSSLGDDGYVPLRDLIDALRRERRFAVIERADIERVVRACSKQRFEIDGDRIRARYGHSVKEAVTYDPVEPPDRLYHGTALRSVRSIREKGLLPMNRQYVHLTPTPELAASVGKRHSKEEAPVILVVHAREAWESGVTFFQPEPRIFLSGPIPPRFLLFESDSPR